MRGTGLQLPRSTIGVSRWRRFRAAVDWPLILVVGALCTIGLFNLYSAVHGTPHEEKFDKQKWHMVFGAVGFVVAVVVDYRALLRLVWIGLGISIVLLIVVQLLGELSTAKGSSRWINIGFVNVQPSEVAKLMIILALARLFQDGDLSRAPPVVLITGAFAVAIPIGLIAIQPDLGNAVLLGLIIVTVGFLVLQSVWPMVHVTLASLLSIPILWETMHEYQQKRVLAFLDPDSNPTTDNWHTRQSIFAVGSGKMWGKGYGEGTQNQFEFLPEHWTDFPFSVWAEEWGFVGSMLLIALYGFLIVWILGVALSARDRMGAVICVGVAAMTFWHVAVNIAMVLGLAPVVGVTLPFISFGGSSLVVFLCAMGLVANVSLRKHGY